MSIEPLISSTHDVRAEQDYRGYWKVVKVKPKCDKDLEPEPWTGNDTERAKEAAGESLPQSTF